MKARGDLISQSLVGLNHDGIEHCKQHEPHASLCRSRFRPLELAVNGHQTDCEAMRQAVLLQQAAGAGSVRTRGRRVPA